MREELQEGGEGLRQGASGMLALHEGAADLTDFCAHTPLAPCHLCNASFDFAAPPSRPLCTHRRTACACTAPRAAWCWLLLPPGCARGRAALLAG